VEGEKKSAGAIAIFIRRNKHTGQNQSRGGTCSDVSLEKGVVIGEIKRGGS